MDGMIFSPDEPRAGAMPRCWRSDFPLVLLGERIFDGPTDHVTMHNIYSAAAAVEHLMRSDAEGSPWSARNSATET